MDFVLHDEGEYSAAEEFLSVFFGPMFGLLEELLGRRPSEPVQVILSSHEKHAERFPPMLNNLVDLDEMSEDAENERDELSRRFPPSVYAFGVTTITDPPQLLPVGVEEGRLAVFLDIDTIDVIAGELGVPFEAMLGQVAVHELSHAFRGHAKDGGTATHGWFKEGDAQRDAWHVLNQLLVDPVWSLLARWGRAAQVRLSDRQPSAYRWFDRDWDERSRLLRDPGPDQVTSWVLGPPRDVFVLTRLRVLETPVSVTARRMLGAPGIGDHIYLERGGMVAGPWVVVASRSESRVRHPKDLAEVDRLVTASRGREEFGWLVMRALGVLMAGEESTVRPTGDLIAKRLNSTEVGELRAGLLVPADELAESLARAAADRRRATVEWANEELRATGQPPLEELSVAFDPFDDWQ